MKRIGIVAAMPGELKPLVTGWKRARQNGLDLWICRQGERELVATCAGAGQSAATRAFAAIEQRGAIDAVLTVGWVGALAKEYVPGRAYRIAGVIDQQTGERFAAAGALAAGVRKESGTQQREAHGEGVWLVTIPRVADAAVKTQLRAAYGAALVDMEAAAVARLAAMRGIPFLGVKGVSDGVEDKLPDLNRFMGPAGEFHLARLIVFVLPRPWLWPALLRMGENSQKASNALAEELQILLAEEG